jgi:hypothetical protein
MDLEGEFMLLKSIEQLQKTYSRIITETDNNEYNVSTRGTCDGIYDWFPMVQRFTRSFLSKIFQTKELRKDKIILEPFLGSGNTLVACREYGKIGFGIDISPFFWFISHVKTSDYTHADFQKAIDVLQDNKVIEEIETPAHSSFKTLFTQKRIRRLLTLRQVAIRLDQKPSELLLFALSSELVNLSKAERFGKGLRKKSARPPNVEATLRCTLKKMEKDCAESKNNRYAQSIPLVGDSRDLGNVVNPLSGEKISLPKGRIDSVITSPPYCNSADYVEMYKLEHWFLRYITSYKGFKEMSSSTIRSHTSFSDTQIRWLHPVVEDICSILEQSQKLWNKKIPTMIRGYFDDMHTALGQMKLLLRKNGRVILLVANSSYVETPIPTDLLLAEAARDQGLRVQSIRKVRRLTTSWQQWNLMDSRSKKLMRESLLIFRSD